MAEQVTLVNGVVLHRWTNPTGDEWACLAYDHGPHCRLCQRVDGTLEAMIQNALDGNFELRAKSDGEFEGRVTEQGKMHARHLIDSTDLGELWDALHENDDEGSDG